MRADKCVMTKLSMFGKALGPVTPIERLKAAIEMLDREQKEALRSVASVRLSAQEADAVRDRGRRIWELRQQLSALGISQ
jgi:hypothetical protein